MTTDEEREREELELLATCLSHLVRIEDENEKINTQIKQAIANAMAPFSAKFAKNERDFAIELDHAVDNFLEILATSRSSSKSIVTAYGTISARTSAGKVVVDEEETVWKTIRKLRLVSLLTVLPKRKLSLTAIKAAIKKDPELEKALKGLHVEKDEIINVKLPKLTLDLVKVDNKFRRVVKKGTTTS